MAKYLPALIFLLIVAAILHEDSVITIFYLLAGLYFVSRWWIQHGVSSVRVKRTFSKRAFLEETIPVRLEVSNTSFLPVVWLHTHESLPVELASPHFIRRVLSLGSHGQNELVYHLHANKRGYYRVGPFFMQSGDLLGLADEVEREALSEYITVYPKIIPLTKVGIPSRSLFGTLKHTQPIFEDPSRVFGKRDYQTGDSLRRVDWKATAASGRMQVKLFEPSIALDTAVFLNLNTDEYDLKTHFYATELAIIVAASLANWIVAQKQAVGLVANGIDPLNDQSAGPIPPNKGRNHLMRILDILARIQAGSSLPFASLIREESSHLSWGTTLILVSNQVQPALFEELFNARKKGLNIVLVIVGREAGFAETKRSAEHFGFPIYAIRSEQDLMVWQA